MKFSQLLKKIPVSYHDFFIKNKKEIMEVYKENVKDKKNGKIIYPEKKYIFRCLIDINKIKVVIFGQDPYHNGSANGYAFSVNRERNINPSLRNIFKEIKENSCDEKEEKEIKDEKKENKNEKEDNDEPLFMCLVKQGCLLLNTALTVIKGEPESHLRRWKKVIPKLITYISEKNHNIVYILLGKKAQEMKKYISYYKAFCEAPHPSPLAHGFIGSGVFKKANSYLDEKIRWIEALE